MGRSDRGPRRRGRPRRLRSGTGGLAELRGDRGETLNGGAKEGTLPIDRATFRLGEYGRVTRSDGTEQWWVRLSRGMWIALSHQRVMDNGDGTITLLYLK